MANLPVSFASPSSRLTASCRDTASVPIISGIHPTDLFKFFPVGFVVTRFIVWRCNAFENGLPFAIEHESIHSTHLKAETT